MVRRTRFLWQDEPRVGRLPEVVRAAALPLGRPADLDLELIESRTLDRNMQELTYRPTLHVHA